MMRRRLLFIESEKWDFIIKPIDGSDYGRFPIRKIAMQSGQRLLVEFSGIVTRSSGHMIADGYFPRATFTGDCITGGETSLLFQANKLTQSDGQFIITATQTGTMTIGNSRTGTDGQESSYECHYIKIRFI